MACKQLTKIKWNKYSYLHCKMLYSNRLTHQRLIAYQIETDQYVNINNLLAYRSNAPITEWVQAVVCRSLIKCVTVGRYGVLTLVGIWAVATV